jgi:hypothetical protein
VAWPPFLPAREALGAEVVARVERVWSAPTLHREVEGRPVAVPLDVYVLFVDAPEVTAAAARRLGLARYTVESLGDGRYRADDGDGARGEYAVLVRAGTRRVVVSTGAHSSGFLGTIRGGALTLVEFEPRGDETGQRLSAWVLIENRAAAALARVLVTLFGFLADRKLREGLDVTAAVAEWAAGHPGEFCAWLAAEALAAPRRQRLAEALACGAPR